MPPQYKPKSPSVVSSARLRMLPKTLLKVLLKEPSKLVLTDSTRRQLVDSRTSSRALLKVLVRQLFQLVLPQSPRFLLVDSRTSSRALSKVLLKVLSKELSKPVLTDSTK